MAEPGGMRVDPGAGLVGDGLMTALDDGPAEPGLLPAELFNRISPVA